MRSSDARAERTSLLALVFVAGCFGPIDHEGRSCPCVAGLVCDEATMRCVRPDRDTGALDVGRADTGTPETGTVDTGTLDTGTVDTGTLDTGTVDAGTVDGGALDTGTLDTGTLDTGTLDTGTLDTGTLDTGTLDTGTLDTGTLDTGVGRDSGDPALDARAPDAFSRDAWAADAFSRDAWAPDAFSRDAGPSPCPMGALLCDDFESVSASRVPPWGYSDGAASRATDRAYRGIASGRYAIMTGGPTQSVGQVLASPAEAWVRGWLYVRPRSGGARSVAFFHFGDDTPPVYDNVSAVLSDMGPDVAIGIYNTVPDVYHEGATIPTDTWTCVALHIRHDVPAGLEGLVELYVGRARVLSIGESVGFAGGAIRVVDVGITYSDASMGPLTMYLDDVAVSTTVPLPCE